jgi:hypothetical protein
MGSQQVDGNNKSFYVGATLANRDIMIAIADALIAKGWTQTYRWGVVDKSQYAATAAAELDGVLSADVFIGVVPGMRLGTSTELGAALANQRWADYALGDTVRVILWAPTREGFTKAGDGLHPSVFVAHPDVERIVGEDPVETIVNYLFGEGIRVLAYP